MVADPAPSFGPPHPSIASSSLISIIRYQLGEYTLVNDVSVESASPPNPTSQFTRDIFRKHRLIGMH